MVEHQGRIFDRRAEFDERSRNYPIRALLDATLPLRSYTWSCSARLNQGRISGCVGFGWAAELVARPAVVPAVTNQTALSIYYAAQHVDEWPGESYDGTSVLAGAKVVQSLGFMPEYRWSFSLDDALRTIGYKGPVVIGVNWYDGMMQTDAAGLIHPTGRNVGGHCVLVNGVSVSKKLVRIHNSWGAGWGVDGDAFLSWADFDRLLGEGGDTCVPVRRVRDDV